MFAVQAARKRTCLHLVHAVRVCATTAVEPFASSPPSLFLLVRPLAPCVCVGCLDTTRGPCSMSPGVPQASHGPRDELLAGSAWSQEAWAAQLDALAARCVGSKEVCKIHMYRDITA